MTRTRGRRPLTCHHEAGHAVARWWMGFHSDNVVVLSVDEVRAGLTVTDRRGREHRCEGLAGGYDIHTPIARKILNGGREDIADRAIFALQAERRNEMALVELYGGPYAEARFMRRAAFECFVAGGMGDLSAVRDVAAGWHAPNAERKGGSYGLSLLSRANNVLPMVTISMLATMCSGAIVCLPHSR